MFQGAIKLCMLVILTFSTDILYTRQFTDIQSVNRWAVQNKFNGSTQKHVIQAHYSQGYFNPQKRKTYDVTNCSSWLFNHGCWFPDRVQQYMARTNLAKVSGVVLKSYKKRSSITATQINSSAVILTHTNLGGSTPMVQNRAKSYQRKTSHEKSGKKDRPEQPTRQQSNTDNIAYARSSKMFTLVMCNKYRHKFLYKHCKTLEQGKRRQKRGAPLLEIQRFIANRIKVTKGKQIFIKQGTKTLVTPLHVTKIFKQFDAVQFRLGSLTEADNFQAQKKERIIVRNINVDLYAMLEKRLLQDHDNLCKVRGLAVANLQDLQGIRQWWPDECSAYALQNAVVKGGIELSCLKTGMKMDLDPRNCYELVNKMSRTWGKVFYPSVQTMVDHIQSLEENVLHLAFNNTHLFFSGALYTCTACIGNLKPLNEQNVLVDGVKKSYNDVLQMAFMNLVWGSQIQFQQLVHILDDIIVRQYHYQALMPDLLSIQQMKVYIAHKFPSFIPDVKQTLTFNASLEFTTLFNSIVNTSADNEIMLAINNMVVDRKPEETLRQVYHELKKFNELLFSRLEHISWIVSNRKFGQGWPLLVMFRPNEQVHNFISYTQSYFGRLRDNQLRSVLHIITDAKISFFQELVAILQLQTKVQWYQQLKPLHAPRKTKGWANATRTYVVSPPNKSDSQSGVKDNTQSNDLPKINVQLNDQPDFNNVRDPFNKNITNSTMDLDNIQSPRVINLDSPNQLNAFSNMLIRRKRSWLSDLLGIATKDQLDTVQGDEFRIIEKENNLELAYQNVQTNTQIIQDRLTTFGDTLKTMQEDDILVLANISSVIGKQIKADGAISDLAASLTASISMSRIYFQLLLEIQLLMGTVQQFQTVVNNILHRRFDFTLFNAGTVTQNLGSMAIDSMLAVDPHVYYSGEEYILKYTLPILSDPVYQYLFQTLETPIGFSTTNTKINIPKQVYLGKDFGEVSIENPSQFCVQSATNIFVCDPQYAVKKEVNPCVRQILLQYLHTTRSNYDECVNYVIPTRTRPTQQYLVFPERGELAFVSPMNTTGLFACDDNYRIEIPILYGFQVFQLRHSPCSLKVGDGSTTIQLPAADMTQEVQLTDITSQTLDVVAELDEFVVEELGLNLSISDMQSILQSVNTTIQGEKGTLQDLARTLANTKKQLVPFNYNPIEIDATDFRGSRGGLVVVFWLIVGIITIALLAVCASCTTVGKCTFAVILWPLKALWIMVKFAVQKFRGRVNSGPYEQVLLLNRNTRHSMKSSSLRTKIKDPSFWIVHTVADIRFQANPETTLYYDYQTKILSNGSGGVVMNDVQLPPQVQQEVSDLMHGTSPPDHMQPE